MTNHRGLHRTALVSALKVPEEQRQWATSDTSDMLPLNFRTPNVKGTVLPALWGGAWGFSHRVVPGSLALTHVEHHRDPRETGY